MPSREEIMKKFFITVFMVLGVIALTHCGENTRLAGQQSGTTNSANPTATISNVQPVAP